MRVIWIVPIIASILILGIIAYSPISFANDDDDNGSPGGSVTLTVVDRVSSVVSVDPDSFGQTEVFCQAGEVVTGGGFHVDGDGFPLVVFSDIEPPNGWDVGVFNLDPCLAVGGSSCGETITFTATVMCATLDGGVGGNGDDDDDNSVP